MLIYLQLGISFILTIFFVYGSITYFLDQRSLKRHRDVFKKNREPILKIRKSAKR